MRRSLKIAVVLVAAAIWGALSWALYPFVVADRCLDAGGALDAATRMCIGAPWSSNSSIVASLPGPAWLFVIGLPGVLVVALLLIVFRILGKVTNQCRLTLRSTGRGP